MLDGDVEGATQTDLAEVVEAAYFAHPISVHLATRTIQGKEQIF